MSHRCWRFPAPDTPDFASMIMESSSIMPLRTNGNIANNAAVAKHPGFAIKFAF